MKRQDNVFPAVVTLSSPMGLELTLVDESYKSLIKTWKNQFRQSFGSKTWITDQIHDAWFANYMQDNLNAIYILRYMEKPVGCVGIRLRGAWDVYNVMLVDKEYRGLGLMKASLKELILLARNIVEASVRVEVLADNSAALNLYMKLGFVQDKREPFVFHADGTSSLRLILQQN